jgi:4-hydroxy-tetrahydrodipicolinate synthase
MDCSAWRVKDRIRSIAGLDITAVVLTPPFYFGGSNAQLLDFFTDVADFSEYPVYLYDLPGATKIKITFDMVKALEAHKNIAGIKSGDIVLVRQITQQFPEFEALYSNLDAFDVAMAYGIDKVLDGMFGATPKNGNAFAKACAAGDYKTAAEKLNNIIYLRDVFAKHSIFPSFTDAMNALGFEGDFGPDFCGNTDEAGRLDVIEALKKIGEL